MTEPLRRLPSAATKTERKTVVFFAGGLAGKWDKGEGDGGDSPDGRCLAFKSTSSGLARPSSSGSLIYREWNTLNAEFSVAR